MKKVDAQVNFTQGILEGVGDYFANMSGEDKAFILVAVFLVTDCRRGTWSFTWNGFNLFSLSSSEAPSLLFSWKE